MKTLYKTVFVGSSEMSAVMQAHPWYQTLLGAATDWPISLKTTVSIMLSSPLPTFVLWGQQRVVLYNDGFRRLFCIEPTTTSLGEPVQTALPSLWSQISSDAERALAESAAVQSELIDLSGCCGDPVAVSTAYRPVHADEGDIGGVMCTCFVEPEAEQKQLTLALKMGKIGTWQLDIATRQLLASGQCKINYGLDEDADFSYDTLKARIHPDDLDWVMAAVETAIAGRTNYDAEYRTVWDDGSTHWVVVRAQVVCDFAGEPEKMVGISTDITARKQAETRVKESERRFRRVVESNMFGVIFGDSFGGIHYGNDYFLNLLGYTPAELESGQIRWDQLTLPKFATLDQRALTALYEHGVCKPYEKVFQYKDGRSVSVLITAAMLQQPYDQRQEIIAIVLDLTETKQVMEARDRFFSLSPDMFAIGNPNGHFTYVNPTWEKILGYTPAEMTAQSYLEFIHPDDRAITIAEADRLSSGNDVVNFENRYRCKGGTYRWLAWNVTNMSAQNQFYAVARDITESKNVAAEREQLLLREQTARESAERANRIKDEFLAVVSHELRSPMNPIVGWTQLLRRGKLSAEKTEQALESIERNAQLQVQLIGDLLDISRILRGKLTLEENRVDLSAVIPAAIETVRQSAELKSVEINTDMAACSVTGDAGRLQQVIWNILSNAVKFTPENGSVSVSLAPVGDRAQITIADTGKGISAEFLPYVFEHFRQEDYSTTRQFGGLGLGLAIVRQVVELHNGSVSVDSAGEGFGTTFTVSFPLAEDMKSSVPENGLVSFTNNLSNVDILLVEDDPDSRLVTAFTLEETNANIVVAASGAEALELIAASVPDLVISDVGMPGMDGYVLIEEIRRRSPEQGGNVLAIALTAYAGEGDRARSLAAGYQRHIAKPVDPDFLITTIVDLLNERASTIDEHSSTNR